MAPHKRYPLEFKRKASRLVVERGYSLRETAEHVGCTTWSLRDWITKFRSSGELPSADHAASTVTGRSRKTSWPKNRIWPVAGKPSDMSCTVWGWCPASNGAVWRRPTRRTRCRWQRTDAPGSSRFSRSTRAMRARRYRSARERRSWRKKHRPACQNTNLAIIMFAFCSSCQPAAYRTEDSWK